MVPGSQTTVRAELFAGLHGARAAAEVELYSDCKHFVDGWGTLKTKPYGLLPNGDLWEKLDEASRHNKVIVKQIKSHMTETEEMPPELCFAIREMLWRTRRPKMGRGRSCTRRLSTRRTRLGARRHG
mmetsp:Transcript_10932/g.29059  ORF Transcript_10932/g.29059 Transcript_10932/m.29059 type:complete len:127 (+) Transcript_10932:3-383(+)